MNGDWGRLFGEFFDYLGNHPWLLVLFMLGPTMWVTLGKAPFDVVGNYRDKIRQLDPRRQEMRKAGDGLGFMILSFLLLGVAHQAGLSGYPATTFAFLGMLGFGLFWLVTGWRRSTGMRDNRHVAYAWRRIAWGVVLFAGHQFILPRIFSYLLDYNIADYGDRRYMLWASYAISFCAVFFIASGVVILILAMKSPPPLRRESPVPPTDWPYGTGGGDDPRNL